MTRLTQWDVIFSMVAIPPLPALYIPPSQIGKGISFYVALCVGVGGKSGGNDDVGCCDPGNVVRRTCAQVYNGCRPQRRHRWAIGSDEVLVPSTGQTCDRWVPPVCLSTALYPFSPHVVFARYFYIRVFRHHRLSGREVSL